MKTITTRREFLKTTAVGVTAMSFTARSYSRILGANERIRLGQIGCGDRGRNAHMAGVHQHDKAENVEYVAVCDPWRVAREQAAALVKEWYGHEAQQFVSYRDLLARSDIDAVMIASCDHQHATHLEAAARAKKHIYIEKPMARHMNELVKAVDAVKAAGVVVQVGTQIRSLPTSTGCHELWQDGVLGKASRIEQSRNSAQPYWYRYVKDVKKEDLDWNEFVMGATNKPFDPALYSGWYGHLEFSDGPVPGFGSHFIDLVHYITGARFPTSCVCLGGVFTWKDPYQFTCPDNVEALWIYPEGFLVSFSCNMGQAGGSRHRYYCEKGQLILDNWTKPTYSGEGARQRNSSISGIVPVKAVEGPDHFQNWLQCMRTGQPTRAPIEAGYQHAVAVIMGVESFNSSSRMIYDSDKREIHKG
jgi:predicted dehydrogenase